MSHFMTATRETRELIGLNRGKRGWVSVVRGTFFEGSRTEMTVETLTIVVRIVELYVFRRGRSAKIIDGYVL